MNKLIIAEKPSVANRIAFSLADNKPSRGYVNGVSYYEILNGSDVLYIVGAAGHLFTLKQKDKGAELPVFDVEWVASWKVNKTAYFTKKYLDVIENIGKRCNFFINACDYDIEGSVIGTNIIKFVKKGDVNSQLDTSNVKRMRFSTTTNEDLRESYKKLEEFDTYNFEAGEARHMLDWMWGINMSRALMRSLNTAGAKRTLSIGRVQGPTLALLATRENEIKNFVSKPFWRVFLSAKGVEFENKRGEIFEKKIAEDVVKSTKGSKVTVKKVNNSENKMRPFPPFDLTSLQLEASRVFRIDPSRTLAIAQVLYERAYVSYPRTSSQKLPYTLNLPRIIANLAKNPKYKELADKLIQSQKYSPAEGSKEDEAHPAIYPTGELAAKLSEEESKIYDLITKRFLACFADWATISKTDVTLGADREEYYASGSVVKESAWLTFYGYYKVQESKVPGFSEGERLVADKVYMKEGKTEPPKRYSKASLIATLEKKDLGTKATRAEIIDTLFRRGYIKGSKIEVTEFGMSVYNALSKYSPEIVDEEMTRRLESDMGKIEKKEIGEMQVINEGKEIIVQVMQEFKSHEKEIGQELNKGLKEDEMANVLGKCPKCGTGNLMVRGLAAKKIFVGCSNWPNCTNTYPLPQNAKVVPTGKVCDICHTPKVKVFRRFGAKFSVFEMDLDPNCPTKAEWKKASEIKAEQPATKVEKKPKARAKTKAKPAAKKRVRKKAEEGV